MTDYIEGCYIVPSLWQNIAFDQNAKVYFAKFPDLDILYTARLFWHIKKYSWCFYKRDIFNPDNHTLDVKSRFATSSISLNHIWISNIERSHTLNFKHRTKSHFWTSNIERSHILNFEHRTKSRSNQKKKYSLWDYTYKTWHIFIVFEEA